MNQTVLLKHDRLTIIYIFNYNFYFLFDKNSPDPDEKTTDWLFGVFELFWNEIFCNKFRGFLAALSEVISVTSDQDCICGRSKEKKSIIVGWYNIKLLYNDFINNPSQNNGGQQGFCQWW